MSALIEIAQAGIGATVQDAGRTGHRHQGVPLSGWLDGPLARATNALLGNPCGEAVLELRGSGTVLRVKAGTVRVALGGRIAAMCLRSDGHRSALPAWQSATLCVGDQLQLGPAESGCAYLGVAGGLLLQAQLGSRSSYWRAGLPGVLGRALRAGDELPCGMWTQTDLREWRCRSPWTCTDGPVRVMLGPQQDHFPPESIALFFSAEWEATAAQDRMGLRLQGPPLAHINPAAADIVSDGVAPGAIQVPANGLPIVLLADGQTVGGYPKMATVISADLPRLAHLRPGTRLRFAEVSPEQALRALHNEHTRWSDWINTRERSLPPGAVNENALYGGNLISGVQRADP